MFEKKESSVFVGEDEERRRKQQRGLVRAAYQPQPTPSLIFKPEFFVPYEHVIWHWNMHILQRVR